MLLVRLWGVIIWLVLTLVMRRLLRNLLGMWRMIDLMRLLILIQRSISLIIGLFWIHLTCRVMLVVLLMRHIILLLGKLRKWESLVMRRIHYLFKLVYLWIHIRWHILLLRMERMLLLKVIISIMMKYMLINLLIKIFFRLWIPF